MIMIVELINLYWGFAKWLLICICQKKVLFEEVSLILAIVLVCIVMNDII